MFDFLVGGPSPLLSRAAPNVLPLDPECLTPRVLFNVRQLPACFGFATQLGWIARHKCAVAQKLSRWTARCSEASTIKKGRQIDWHQPML
jgi:hypothetical protein